MHATGQIELSIVIPLLDEEGSIAELIRRCVTSVERLALTFEIVCVDDGSADGTFTVLEAIAAQDGRVAVLRFDRNYGQTAALVAGFAHASGEVVVALDGDLQNDPADIGRLLERLDAGADVVSGWRRDRRDRALSRRLPSLVGNWLISRASGVSLHDHGCTLKAYRSEVARLLSRHGETHRLLAVVAARSGARISEIEVQHHPRTTGRSKYGLERTPQVLLDLARMWLFRGSGVLARPRAQLAALLLRPFPQLEQPPVYRLRETLNLDARPT